MAGSLVDQAQLEDSLQQQQAVTQQMLDVMNEKIENWVCQCFSDLRNRIIELVRNLAMQTYVLPALTNNHGARTNTCLLRL